MKGAAMRFSIAIDRIVAREPEPTPATDAPGEAADASMSAPGSLVLPPPPLELDQRVRLTGEW
jgi:hypothetical protein